MASLDDIARAGAQAAKTAVAAEVNRQIGEVTNRLRGNPGGPLDDDSEEDTGEDDDEDGDESAPEDEYHYYTDANAAAENLACAVAAYRAFGTGEHGIAVCKALGYAVMGPLEDLGDEIHDYSKQNGISPSGWRVHDDPRKILSMEYDQDELCAMAEFLCDEDAQDEAQAAAEKYEAFNWNHDSRRCTHVSIPGITGTLYELGQALRSDYRSDKDNSATGTTIDYTHKHGEETGELPKFYALNEHTLIVHGPGLYVAPEGVRN